MKFYERSKEAFYFDSAVDDVAWAHRYSIDVPATTVGDRTLSPLLTRLADAGDIVSDWAARRSNREDTHA